jgi:hypothetical protein
MRGTQELFRVQFGPYKTLAQAEKVCIQVTHATQCFACEEMAPGNDCERRTVVYGE